MNARTRPATRRLAAALAAAVAAGALAGAGGGPAVAAAPPIGAGVELAYQLGTVDGALLADDAVYFADTPRDTEAIYRRPMTTGPGGTALGDAEVVALSAGYTRFAEHAGTLAYTRAGDGRLALRAPDGTTTTPAWATPQDVAGGVLALTSQWLLASDTWGGDYAGLRLFERADGTEHELWTLAPQPAPFAWPSVTDWVLTDSRLLWIVDAVAPDESAERLAVYTVPLGPDGPVGPPVELASTVTDLTRLGPSSYFSVVDASGPRVMWQRFDCTTPGTCTSVLQWYDDAPYAGAPRSRSVTGWVEAVDGDQVVTSRGNGVVTTLEWSDLAAPGTVRRTVDVGPMVDAIAGSLVVHSPVAGGTTVLADVSGAPVTMTTTWVPVLRFVDVDWSDPFILPVQWMTDSGITTGYADGTFRSTSPVNRDAMAAFLYRLARGSGAASGCAATPFVDVAATYPFCPEITWLASTGVTTGWPDGTYRPEQPVTREAMAAFLYRFAHRGGRAPACTTTPFVDVSPTHPFCGEIAWLASVGVTTGWADGTFRPGAFIERQAMAAFLWRFQHAGLVPAT